MITITKTSDNLFDVEQNNIVIKSYKCEADAIRFKDKLTSKQNEICSPVLSSVKVSLPNKFSITQRFEFLSQLVSMVLNNVSPSLLVTGSGGLGKTYAVMSMLENKIEDVDYVVIKGFSTARGLYNKLCDNADKIVIFDDTDSILKDPVALNVLKAALDSYDRRVISWNAMMSTNDPYPNSFEFTGSIIFISNLSMNSMNQALISRSLVLDLDMSTADKLERMNSILADVLPEIDMLIKQDAFNFLEKNADKCSDLNMRTLIKVCKIRDNFPTNWEDLALYSMTI